MIARRLTGTLLVSLASLLAPIASAETLTGTIRDSVTGRPIAARLYIESDGKWFHAESSRGSHAHYNKSRNGGKSVEIHSALSAGRFVASLPPGDYMLTAECGKEYFTATEAVTVRARETATVDINLRRWIHMANRGWYSGDTHVHLPVGQLKTYALAEDLNVSFPLTGWVTKAYDSPEPTYRKETGEVQDKLVHLDASHVIQPLNTEWEIFTVDGKRHTLGAVFAIGHKQPFRIGTPPVRPIAERVRQQGALLELDKHNWPWSMMIIPVMNVDLFELTNNHIWRTNFAFSNWYPEYTAPYMNVEKDADGGFTERGWIEFGLQNYYTMLNCGFRMRPTGGTASGVHPVPAGFGRVYVEQPEGFSYEDWIAGLNKGRSFVTTGPMLFVRANDQPPGSTLRFGKEIPVECRLVGSVVSTRPLSRIEIIVNGRIARRWEPDSVLTASGASRSRIDISVPLVSSAWVAVRCFEPSGDGRVRFAHSSPVHFELEGRPLRPRKVETAYLIKRVEDELKRHEGVLPDTALDEYREALQVYRTLAKQADDP